MTILRSPVPTETRVGKKMKISQKLILVFLLIALLIWAVGGYAVYESRKALTQSIGEGSVSLARKILDEIDRDIHSKIEIFQTHSKDFILQAAVAKSNQEFNEIDNVQAYISQKDQEWVSAPKGTITPFMQKLLSGELSRELRGKLKFYEEEYGYSVFPEIYVTNKYGVIIATTGRTSDYLQADEQWYQTAVKEEKFWVGEVEYDESSDAYANDIVVNLYDDNGNFSGIIKAVFNIEEIINIIKTGETVAEDSIREFKLITKDGKIIYATEGFQVFENISDKLLSQFKESEKERRGYFIAEGDQPGEGEELFAHVHSKGYRDFRGLGWILIVERKTKEIFVPVAKLRNRILIISLAIAILATLIGLYISRSISRPLAKLRDAAAEIGKGNLNARIEIKSNDEVGQLADSFKKMTADLKHTTTSIDNLNAANQQLESEITDRKKAENQRAQLLKKVESVNNELKDFAYIVSHDLKTPLRGISTLAHWISDDYADKLGADGKGQMELLLSHVGRMHDLIEGVLQYSSVGRIREELVEVELGELVPEVIDNVAAPENISITIEDELPAIVGEHTRIMQVFQNLLSNAVKYMDKPAGQIRIGCVDEGDCWKFSVADNGPGIEERHFKRIFKVFQTVSDRDGYESTGVGLSVVKKIVEIYGGKIWVESEVGKGSSFFFTLAKPERRNKDAKLEANIAH